MGSLIGRFAVRHAATILFLTAAACLGGAYVSMKMPSSVFPKTDFPRVIIMAKNGVMPADEMMATVTRPIEESMKDIPGAVSVRSSTGRGAAEIDVFFDWSRDMVRSEFYVSGRLAQIRSELPTTATTSVYRMTFAVFPIIGISLTSPTRSPTELWELARYEIKPRFLRISGVANVELVGGEVPEYQVAVDPARLAALHLGLSDVVTALKRENLETATGMMRRGYTLSLTVVDGRVHSIGDIENLVVQSARGDPVPIKDIARVYRGAEPSLSVVSAQGKRAVLLNVFAQPDGSTLEIADQLRAQLREIRGQLPPDVTLSYFYDQSLFVRHSVGGVWEAIVFGLGLSVLIIFLFLRSWGTTLVAIAVIPVTVLVTVLGMKACGMTFNVLTLGGIAAAIGLVIDDAIVVVEAIHAQMAAGESRDAAIRGGIGEIFAPLLGSTLTPVVVFIPLAFLTGVSGVFFRALAITMVVALLTSLVLALTLTPSLASRLVRLAPGADPGHDVAGGLLLRFIVGLYELTLRRALRHRVFAVALCALLLAAAAIFYRRLGSNFLPAMDEGGFIIDYIAPPGSSLTETDRQMRVAEAILARTPEVESYSRRTGAQLGVALAEPNTGDFLVKLRSDRKRSTQKVLDDVRTQIETALPAEQWDFPGILSDLIGDLSYTDTPIEVKLYSTDLAFLKKKAVEIEDRIKIIPGVVDTNNGLVFTGTSISLRVRPADALRLGVSAADVADAVGVAMLGQTASSVLEGDRTINIRVHADPASVDRVEKLRELPIHAAGGANVYVGQVADVVQTPGQLELERDNLRQNVSITAGLEGRDLGSAMAEIRSVLARDASLPPGSIAFGGLYEQQQDSFHALLVALAMAVALVFTVALIEFRSFYAPLAIVFGATLSTVGIIAALTITGTTLNIVTFLGAIIGMGVVHKNGILMLDHVEYLRGQGLPLVEALVHSGRRRLRPVLMTSMAAGLGMLPLALGVGSGADMLRPLAIAIIGAVCVSVLLSLVATPTAYFALLQARDGLGRLFRRDDTADDASADDTDPDDADT